MTPVLRDGRRDRGQLGHVMASRIASAVPSVQAVRTAATRLRLEMHDRLHALDGDQCMVVPRMSRLTTSLASTLHATTTCAQACLEDLDYAPRRELDRPLIRQLATGRWIAEHRNVLITGATGVGKTYVACALGQHACRQGYRAIYRRLPRFFQELALARADGSYTIVLARLARVDVLILDDWGLAALTDVQRQDLLEVMEDRDASRSTIITSQLPRDQWHAYLGDPTIADAVLDRLVHNAFPITRSPSRRQDMKAPQ